MNPRPRWIWIGHGLTAVWIGGVIVLTRGSPDHVLFDTIFTVPLAGWVLALIIRRLISKQSGTDAERP